MTMRTPDDLFRAIAEDVKKAVQKEKARLVGTYGVNSYAGELFYTLVDGFLDSRFPPQEPSSTTSPAADLDPYSILGVARGDPLTMIRAVYRAKAKYLHPDNVATGDQVAFIRLKAAYDRIIQERGGSAKSEP